MCSSDLIIPTQVHEEKLLSLKHQKEQVTLQVQNEDALEEMVEPETSPAKANVTN